jgi:putative permease
MQVVADWFRRYFSDPQVVFLALFLVVGFAVVLTMGDMLTPVLASAVIAYLLNGLVELVQRWGVPRLVAVVLVFTLFITFVALVVFGILPLLSRQVTELVQQIPSMIAQGQKALMQLPERYPEIVTAEQIQQLFGAVRNELATFGQEVLSLSLASVVGFLTIAVYMILMPLLVFFFLKDKALIIGWFKRYLPRHRRIAKTVWHDVDRQISNYVRGKFWEILIIWSASFVTFPPSS